MKISFITPCSNLLNFGVRSLSSYLKSQGHQVELIFVIVQKNQFTKTLSDQVLDQIKKQVQDENLIGLSFTTNFLGFAEQITRKLRKDLPDTPLIWGGIHATSEPERCLEETDFVCVGEGEEALSDLALALKYKGNICNIPNIWVKQKGQIFRNNVRHLCSNLDNFPDSDYDLTNQFILADNQIIPLTKNLLKTHLMKMKDKSRYSVFTTRGCSHACQYCCNSFIKKLYEHKGQIVRKRSLDRVFAELKHIIYQFNFESVCIQDENFLVRSLEEIKYFCQRYKKEINLPFQCEFSPQTFQKEKIQHLIDAGLCSVQIGIQSIDEKTLQNYYRYYTKEKVDEIVEFFSSYQDKVKINFHFLTHNPWETKESLVRSIKYVASLPSWINVKIYPLIFFPSSSFYYQAKTEGLIQGYYQDIVYKNWGIERLREGGFEILLFYWVNFLRRTGESIEVINTILDTLLFPSVRKKFSNNNSLLKQLGDFLINKYKDKGWE